MICADVKATSYTRTSDIAPAKNSPLFHEVLPLKDKSIKPVLTVASPPLDCEEARVPSLYTDRAAPVQLYDTLCH